MTEADTLFIEHGKSLRKQLGDNIFNNLHKIETEQGSSALIKELDNLGIPLSHYRWEKAHEVLQNLNPNPTKNEHH